MVKYLMNTDNGGRMDIEDYKALITKMEYGEKFTDAMQTAMAELEHSDLEPFHIARALAGLSLQVTLKGFTVGSVSEAELYDYCKCVDGKADIMHDMLDEMELHHDLKNVVRFPNKQP
jgi:hypothetical protein